MIHDDAGVRWKENVYLPFGLWELQIGAEEVEHVSVLDVRMDGSRTSHKTL